MGALVLLAFFAGMVVLAVRAPRTALLTTVFFASWSGFDADFGLRVSAYQLTVAAVLTVTILRSLQPGWQPERVAAVRLLAGFLVFATVLSLGQLAFLPDVEIALGGLRSPAARATIQIALFAFSISPALLIAWTMRDHADLRAILKAYLLGVGVLGLIGWFQLAVWYTTGSNPLPIGVINDWLGGSAEGRTASFDFASLALNRMNSFAGEPRQLGTALVFAMLLIQSVMLTATKVEWRWLILSWAFFFITAVPTYSTSAAAVWVIGTIVQLTLPWLLGVRIRRSIGQLSIGVFAVALPLLLAVGLAEARGIPVLDLLAERTITRLDETGAVEDFDLAILDYFAAHPESLPLGTGLGNAHLYAGSYLGIDYLWYAEGNVFTAKTQYLKIISELGLVGLALFLVWYAVLTIDVARAIRRPGGDGLSPIIPIAVMTLVVFLANNSVAAEFWTVAGALAVAATALRNSGRDVRPVPSSRIVLA